MTLQCAHTGTQSLRLTHTTLVTKLSRAAGLETHGWQYHVHFVAILILNWTILVKYHLQTKMRTPASVYRYKKFRKMTNQLYLLASNACLSSTLFCRLLRSVSQQLLISGTFCKKPHKHSHLKIKIEQNSFFYHHVLSFCGHKCIKWYINNISW